MLEADIEKAVCDWARKEGWLVYKFVSVAYRSVPDRMFIRLGTVAFIEFKAPGKRPTVRQQREIEKLQREGIFVSVQDDIEKAKDWLADVYRFDHAP